MNMKMGPFSYSRDKLTTGMVLGLLFAWISLYFIGSYLTLCAITSLFPGLNIAMTFESVLSIFWLTALVSAIVGSSK